MPPAPTDGADVMMIGAGVVVPVSFGVGSGVSSGVGAGVIIAPSSGVGAGVGGGAGEEVVGFGVVGGAVGSGVIAGSESMHPHTSRTRGGRNAH